MSLKTYNKKRDFKKTTEPKGKVSKEAALRFVVQRHHATRIHYDFRLEMDGTLKSWAVPKGPSLNPDDKRLAVLVEDHPVSYIDFEGIIPEGNYGAGTVEVWDNGHYEPVNEKGNVIDEKTAISNFNKGHLKIVLKGKKIKGGFALVRLNNNEDENKNWLLIKHKDKYSTETEYNSEDYSKHKKLEDKIKASQPQKKKPVEKYLSNNYKPEKSAKLETYIKPMLASITDKVFDSDEWLYELKLDGYRAIAEIGTDNVKFYSRNGISFLQKYPVITDALKKIKHTAILDGEVVLIDEEGKPSFQKLQHYEDNTEYELVYYVFDLLMLNGIDTKSLELIKRKELLEKLLGKNKIIKYCSHINDKGTEFYKKIVAQNMEGIMAKLKDSVYLPGVRTKNWLKIKNIQTHEAVIAGFTEPKGSRKFFGALILGQYKEDKLEYIGHTGTGFNDQSLKELYNLMKPLIVKKSPFETKIKVNAPVTWVNPKIVVEINFTEMTEDKIMRHPVFIRVRSDKEPKEAVMDNKVKIITNEVEKEKTETPKKSLAISAKDKSKFSNLDKVYWPEKGYTKGDLINYYNEVSKYILPYLKDRPLSLKRNPNGITDQGFYHKDAGGDAPEWVQTKKIFSDSSKKDIEYIICNDKRTLLYLANLGCIEFNPWNSTTESLENPTYIVIDIDPSDDNTFEQVIETAQVVKSVLDKAGAPGYCKTSGATGLHIYVPMGSKYEYEMAKEFAHIIAVMTHEQLPAFTSIERNLNKRGNKIYVDFLQNRKGQTLASAYSLRPRPEATVSTPLEWEEVKKGLHPTDFTMKNIFTRIEKKGDLFGDILKKGIDIAKCLKKLDS